MSQNFGKRCLQKMTRNSSTQPNLQLRENPCHDAENGENESMKTFSYSGFMAGVFLLIMVLIGGSLWADQEEFEDESLTITLAGNWFSGTFDKVKTTVATPDPTALRYETEADNPTQFAPSLDVTYSWNWDDVFVGISANGTVGLRQEGSSVLATVYKSSTSRSKPQPFTIEQYLYGALFELGWRSAATDWVYIGTNVHAKTTYGDPTFHFGFGVGPYVHTVVSDQKTLAGTQLGWMGSFRWQWIVVEGWGLDFASRIHLIDGMNRITGTVGAGVFYKVF